jgi:uncharacterized protein (TIGR03083 family)
MGGLTGEQGIDALEEIWSSIASLTESLSDEQWSTPTDCPGWDVKDHLSHIIGTERSMAGESAPPLDVATASHVKNPMGEANERWVVSRRGVPGAQVRHEFVEVTAERCRSLRSLDAEAFEKVGWSPIGDVPFRVFLEVRAMDCWIHEQDLRLALGFEGGRGGRGEAVSLYRVEQALGQVLGKGVRPPEGTSITVVVNGPLPKRYRYEIVEGRARSVEAATSTTTLELDALDYLLRFGGRISTAQVMSDEATAISGDPALAEAFVGALALMI